MSAPLRDRAWEWWDRHHARLGWAALGALLGGVIAAFVTSAATACAGGKSCSVSWEAVEAIGTWFGAVGGLLAVGAAIATLRSGDRARLVEQRRQAMSALEREAQERIEAGRIKVSPGMTSWNGNTLLMVHLDVRNQNTKLGAYRVEVEVDLDAIEEGWGVRDLGSIHTLPPNKTQPVTLQFGHKRLLRQGLPEAPDLPPSVRTSWFDQLVESVTLTYVIEDVRWRRRGTGVPERLGPQ